MSSEDLMGELESFLNMGASPAPPGPSASPRAAPKPPESAPAPGAGFGSDKRKLEESPGHDEIGSYNLNSPAKMPKMEVKEEPGLARSSSLSNLRLMGGGLVKTEEGLGLVKAEEGEGGYGEGREQAVEPERKCQQTAARIRGALEASGLSGNLTTEDLQTLKRLNEIAKSTGLNQEQKSGEASQLLKKNPNVSRFLLKL